MKKHKIILQVVVFFGFVMQGFSGQSYYISTQGNDSNPGTLGSPWGSLQHAFEVAGAADTVFMRGGVYQTDEVWIRGDRGMGGANGQYLTIKNYPGEVPSVGGERRVIVDGPPYLRIEGLYFRLPYRISGGGIGFQVVNNTFEGPQPPYGAIEFFADDGLVAGNVITISGDGDTQDHGIYLHAGHNNVLRNNIISGISGYAIHVYDAVSSGGAEAAAGYDNILIEGNVLYNSQFRAGIIVSPAEGVEARNIMIRKNTIFNNVINGIRISGDAHDIEIYNNTIYGNGFDADHPDDQSAISFRSSTSHDAIIRNNIIEITKSGAFHIQNRQGSAGIVAERNLYWGTSEPRLSEVIDSEPLFYDPQFQNPQQNNFQLQEASPAIDAGLDVGLPFRGTAPDLGSIEFGDQTTTSTGQVGNQPAYFRLYQNYPNPFNPSTQIVYEVKLKSRVTLSIYDVSGRNIKTLVDGEHTPGSFVIVWDGNNDLGQRVASGIYFYQLVMSSESSPGTVSAIRKMTLLR